MDEENTALRVEKSEPRKVRMSVETLDFDEACRLVGRFCCKARQQGWAEEDIEQVLRGITVGEAFEHLRPYIEKTAPEPIPWYGTFRTTGEYFQGYRVFCGDAGPNPLHQLARWMNANLRRAR